VSQQELDFPRTATFFIGKRENNVDSDCGVASVAVKLHSVQFLAVLWVLVLK
jgi:hypothetical protein